MKLITDSDFYKSHAEKWFESNTGKEFYNSFQLNKIWGINGRISKGLTGKFAETYDLGRNSEAEKEWNNFLTQRMELWVTKEDRYLQKEVITMREVRTPIIRSGEDPSMIYDCCNAFVQKYGSDIEMLENLLKNSNLSENKEFLEKNWKRMSGRDIEHHREIIELGEEKAGKRYQIPILQGVKENLELLDKWKWLREGKDKALFKYDWVAVINR